MRETVYDFQARNIKGELQSLKDFEGKALLIVNTASRCGFTNQYAGLESLYEKYKEQGFAVLGFPCNQFGGQEPGNEEEIQQFCSLNFGVSFPLFAKVDVNGAEAHPLFRFLKQQAPGLLGTKDIKWNFTKFLIGRDGEVLKRFAPQDTPESLEKEVKSVVAP